MTTARQICTRALQLDGIIAANEAGDAADLDFCLGVLNDMWEAWGLNRNNILTTTVETFPLVLNQASYTIGVGQNFNTTLPISIEESSFIRYQTVDYSLTEIDEETYSLIPYKVTGGIPETYYYSRDVSVGTLFLYPVPQSGQTIELHSVKPFTAFSALDVNYLLAPGYKNTLQYSLAEAIAPAFERDPPKFVAVEAIKSRKSLKRSNVVVPILEIDQVPVNTGTDWNTWRSYP